MANYTFEQLQEAVQEGTATTDLVEGKSVVYSFDLQQVFGDEHECYILVDPFGDQDGDDFYSLDEVEEYITDSPKVVEYLKRFDN